MYNYTCATPAKEPTRGVLPQEESTRDWCLGSPSREINNANYPA